MTGSAPAARRSANSSVMARDHGRALLVVRGVHVVEHDLAAGRLDLLAHRVGRGDAEPQVQVDADDVEPGARPGLAHGGAEAAARPEHQRPALAAAVPLGHLVLASCACSSRDVGTAPASAVHPPPSVRAPDARRDGAGWPGRGATAGRGRAGSSAVPGGLVPCRAGRARVGRAVPGRAGDAASLDRPHPPASARRSRVSGATSRPTDRGTTLAAVALPSATAGHPVAGTMRTAVSGRALPSPRCGRSATFAAAGPRSDRDRQRSARIRHGAPPDRWTPPTAVASGRDGARGDPSRRPTPFRPPAPAPARASGGSTVRETPRSRRRPRPSTPGRSRRPRGPRYARPRCTPSRPPCAGAPPRPRPTSARAAPSGCSSSRMRSTTRRSRCCRWSTSRSSRSGASPSPRSRSSRRPTASPAARRSSATAP